jgi:hypothetical protein
MTEGEVTDDFHSPALYCTECFESVCSICYEMGKYPKDPFAEPCQA